VDGIGIAAVVVAVALGAFVKGTTGAGLPLIAIPVLATFVGPEEAVVVMTIPTFSNLMMIRALEASNIGDLVQTPTPTWPWLRWLLRLLKAFDARRRALAYRRGCL
jgi:hypothetical protein